MPHAGDQRCQCCFQPLDDLRLLGEAVRCLARIAFEVIELAINGDAVVLHQLELPSPLHPGEDETMDMPRIGLGEARLAGDAVPGPVGRQRLGEVVAG